MLKELREFILRGSLIELAVAVVIGTAFGAVIAALIAATRCAFCTSDVRPADAAV
jgi:large-conductance mechanosensitive channel